MFNCTQTSMQDNTLYSAYNEPTTFAKFQIERAREEKGEKERESSLVVLSTR